MSETNAAGSEIEAPQETSPIPEQRVFEAREHFETPSWMGPRLADPQTEQRIPAQAVPTHETFEPQAPPQPTRDVAIISEGHWAERAKPRLFAGTLLLLALAGVVGCLVVTIISQSVVAVAGLVASAIVAVIFRGALMSSGLTTVELKGATLKVRREGMQEMFNLADPVHMVQMTGDPGDPSWRVRLEALGGGIVELTPAQVNPHELAPVIDYYRLIAERERVERERRFNR